MRTKSPSHLGTAPAPKHESEPVDHGEKHRKCTAKSNAMAHNFGTKCTVRLSFVFVFGRLGLALPAEAHGEGQTQKPHACTPRRQMQGPTFL
eukprot:1982715-Rhodomonas_salina.1